MRHTTNSSTEVAACAVAVSEDALTAGRTIAVPLGWYPRLVAGSDVERADWRLIGQGEGIHWPVLDEDVSVANLLLGQPSGESARSFARWLAERSGQQSERAP